MKDLSKHAILFVLAITLFGCSSGDEPSTEHNTKDRKIMLEHWADNIIIPSYSAFQDDLDAMADKADAFTTSPNETTLTEFRDAWIAAYMGWQKVELFEFGPAYNYSLRNYFNIYPADVNGIITNMNDPEVDLTRFASYPTQGFPALDYLINGVGADDAAIVAAYTDADADKRIAYVQRVVARMQTLLGNVVADWNGYRDTFVTSTGLDVGSSTGLVVNAYVLNYERYIRSGKIGIPSGTAIGSTGEAYPERIEAYYKRDISRDLAIAAHEASRDFFKGKHVLTGDELSSFESYLHALGAKDATTNTLLSDIISEQFSTISGELEDLSPDLHEQIATNNVEMEETYAAMQKLVRLLKVDMTSAMSVTITYTDNDGD